MVRCWRSTANSHCSATASTSLRPNPHGQFTQVTIAMREGSQCEFVLEVANRPGVRNGRGEMGRVPRLSRLMALAIHFDQLIREGKVADYAELARLGNVTRARVTQIMNLLNLAPQIQEEILCLPETRGGRDPINEHAVRRIPPILDWSVQLHAWSRLKAQRACPETATLKEEGGPSPREALGDFPGSAV